MISKRIEIRNVRKILDAIDLREDAEPGTAKSFEFEKGAPLVFFKPRETLYREVISNHYISDVISNHYISDVTKVKDQIITVLKNNPDYYFVPRYSWIADRIDGMKLDNHGYLVTYKFRDDLNALDFIILEQGNEDELMLMSILTEQGGV